MLSKIKQTGWSESTRQEGSGHKTKTKSNNLRSPEIKPKLESMLYFGAEWVSVKEVNALQGACMRTSAKARDRQNEELLSDLDDPSVERFVRGLMEEEGSPAL